MWKMCVFCCPMKKARTQNSDAHPGHNSVRNTCSRGQRQNEFAVQVRYVWRVRDIFFLPSMKIPSCCSQLICVILGDTPQKGLCFLTDVGDFYSLSIPHSFPVPDVTTGEPLSPVSCDPSAAGQV